MRRARRTRLGGAPPADLRALLALVVEALNERGLHLVTPPAAVAGAGSVMWSQTTSSGRAHHRPERRPRPDQVAPTPTSGRHQAPDNDPHDGPSDGPSDGDATGDGSDASGDEDTGYTGGVADEHVEIWQLVERAQAGDGEAFGQLYDRYVDTVFRFIYFRVNDRALAEDFTSETFLRALRRISTITYQGRDIGAWFVTIARNIILDHMKSARNRLEITTGETVEGNRSEPSPEAAVLDLLTSERLMEAVRQLGDEQRECVMLRFIQGFSVSETAAAMGKNDGAIKALQHRAVRKLAELVGGELR